MSDGLIVYHVGYSADLPFAYCSMTRTLRARHQLRPQRANSFY